MAKARANSDLGVRTGEHLLLQKVIKTMMTVTKLKQKDEEENGEHECFNYASGADNDPGEVVVDDDEEVAVVSGDEDAVNPPDDDNDEDDADDLHNAPTPP